MKEELTKLLSGMEGEPKCACTEGVGDGICSDKIEWNTAKAQAEKIIELLKPVIKEAFRDGLRRGDLYGQFTIKEIKTIAHDHLKKLDL